MPKSTSKSFNEWFSLLSKFKDEYGHCSVKRNDPNHHQLSMWVNRIRKKYRNGLLPDAQIDQLKDIGFEWSVISQTLPFEDGIKFLEEYKQRHGNCSVPYTYPSNQRLATWVHNQRAQFVRKQRQLPSYLSDERIERLTNVGLFDFTSLECYRSICQIARSAEKRVAEKREHTQPHSKGSPPRKPLGNKAVSSQPITLFFKPPKTQTKTKVKLLLPS